MESSALTTTIFAPSIVYDRDDPWVTSMRRLALLPVLPISGSGRAAYQPIWAGDVARCVTAALDQEASGRIELAGPEVLTYEQIARLIARAAGRQRPVLHVPLNAVRPILTRCAAWWATPSSPPGRRRSSSRCP